MDLFGAGANKANKEKEPQLFDGKPITMENNALKALFEERRAEAEAAIREAQTWSECIDNVLSITKDVCRMIGRNIESLRYDGGTNIWIRLTGEAVKLPVGRIRDEKDLATACMKVIGAVFMV